PAVFAGGEIPPRTREDRLRAAHVLDVSLRLLDGRQRIEVGGVSVIPAEIFLVDCLHVVAYGAVVVAVLPFLCEALWQNEGLGDFCRRHAVVHHADGLVMDVFIEVALLGKIFANAYAAPHWPVMLADQRLGIAGATFAP